MRILRKVLNMNMDSTIQEIEQEIIETNGYELLPDKIQEKIYKQITLKSKSKLEYIQKLKLEGFSNDMTALLLGLIIGLEQKKKTRINLLPAFLRK